MSTFYVFTGNFGSGKSELAINMALKKKAALVDLDIVNPYFKSGEQMDILQTQGVRVIAPNYIKEKIEIVSLSAEVFSAFNLEGDVIFDAGGDVQGSTALGAYKSHFDNIPPGDLNVLFVINPYRPMIDTAQKAYDMLAMIQSASRLPITGLINNANLGEETDTDCLLTGYSAVRELSDMTQIPVFATSGQSDMLQAFQRYAAENSLDKKYIGDFMPIEIKMNRSWSKFLGEG